LRVTRSGLGLVCFLAVAFFTAVFFVEGFFSVDFVPLIVVRETGFSFALAAVFVFAFGLLRIT
jgi:hypothetical protein